MPVAPRTPTLSFFVIRDGSSRSRGGARSSCSRRCDREDDSHPMPLMDGLRVVASSIHGYGVVTTRRFLRGETVSDGDGVLYTEDADFDDTYALVLPAEDSGLGELIFWDLTCQTRRFNHSCD